MKNLYLMRHAKSSWDDPVRSDIERPLNPRGQRDAPRMGEVLGARLAPMTFHVSPAARAQLTFSGLQMRWPGLTASHGLTIPALYTFDYRALIQWMAGQGTETQSLALVGHNPGLTDLINFLVGHDTLTNLPTAGWVELALDMEGWAEMPRAEGSGQLDYRLFPRELSEAI